LASRHSGLAFDRYRARATTIQFLPVLLTIATLSEARRTERPADLRKVQSPDGAPRSPASVAARRDIVTDQKRMDRAVVCPSKLQRAIDQNLDDRQIHNQVRIV
jgi:hypothetical protein